MSKTVMPKNQVVSQDWTSFLSQGYPKATAQQMSDTGTAAITGAVRGAATAGYGDKGKGK